jgi:hypothetical protein
MDTVGMGNLLNQRESVVKTTLAREGRAIFADSGAFRLF